MMRNDGPSVVTTKTLRADGAATPPATSCTTACCVSARPRSPRPATPDADPALRDGRTITDTFYNSLGETAKSNTGYFATGAPSTELLAVADTDVPTPGRDRPSTAPATSAPRPSRRRAWRSGGPRTTQEGDRVHVTPPPGGTATTRISDAEGRLIELRQYKGATPTGDYDATKYTYDHAGQLSTVTDPAGNVWRHHYDLRGREIKTEDPDKGVTTMTYNDADELLTHHRRPRQDPVVRLRRAGPQEGDARRAPRPARCWPSGSTTRWPRAT